MDTTVVGFIGFGLIGGSIARALKEIDGSIPSTLTKKMILLIQTILI